MEIKVKKLSENAIIPQYMTPGASGFDLHASEDVAILPGETKLVPIGLAFAIPEGFELQIRPRSGNSYKTSMRVANSPGTVDADFRGEVCVIIHNALMHDSLKHQAECYVDFERPYSEAVEIRHLTNIDRMLIINKGDRIAQGVVCPVAKFPIVVVDELDSTKRGSDGFGSTGV